MLADSVCTHTVRTWRKVWKRPHTSTIHMERHTIRVIETDARIKCIDLQMSVDANCVSMDVRHTKKEANNIARRQSDLLLLLSLCSICVSMLCPYSRTHSLAFGSVSCFGRSVSRSLYVGTHTRAHGHIFLVCILCILLLVYTRHRCLLG